MLQPLPSCRCQLHAHPHQALLLQQPACCYHWRLRWCCPLHQPLQALTSGAHLAGCHTASAGGSSLHLPHLAYLLLLYLLRLLWLPMALLESRWHVRCAAAKAEFQLYATPAGMQPRFLLLSMINAL